jgi:hypothetical protein
MALCRARRIALKALPAFASVDSFDVRVRPSPNTSTRRTAVVGISQRPHYYAQFGNNPLNIFNVSRKQKYLIEKYVEYIERYACLLKFQASLIGVHFYHHESDNYATNRATPFASSERLWS